MTANPLKNEEKPYFRNEGWNKGEGTNFRVQIISFGYEYHFLEQGKVFEERRKC